MQRMEKYKETRKAKLDALQREREEKEVAALQPPKVRQPSLSLNNFFDTLEKYDEKRQINAHSIAYDTE